ncbi:MAG: TIGR02221 family CRISPR-associated protein [Clostridiales bacterium]|nr:TIGR02221 family CRISPR-associated protein [Clostridiales bacterium]
MAKILIASIGNGSYNKETNSYEYRAADYTNGFGGTDTVHTAYVYDALKKFHDVDKCVFVGTAGSNWHLLYEHLYDKDSVITPALPEKDTDYSFELLELWDSPDKHLMDPDAVSAKLQKLREALGGFCLDILVLKYGINRDELDYNFVVLTKIAEYVRNGDEVYFDITHSFRSLAVYELLAVNYIKDAAGKKIELKYVSYGMLEASKENGGKTPIVDLLPLVDIFDFIKVAEEYERYGTAYLLYEIKDTQTLGLSKEEKKAVKRLGDVVTASNIAEFKNLVKNCRNIAKRNGAGIATEKMVEEITRLFGKALDEDDDFLLRMEIAKWHIHKKRTQAAVITLTECILDYFSKASGIKRDTYEDDTAIRRAVRSFRSSNSEAAQFVKYYENGLRPLRNKVCHGVLLESNEFTELEKLCKHFPTAYARHFKNNPENYLDLQEGFQQ